MDLAVEIICQFGTNQLEKECELEFCPKVLNESAPDIYDLKEAVCPIICDG